MSPVFTHAPLPEHALKQTCLQLDLSRANTTLREVDTADPEAFRAWLEAELKAHACTWAFGGYAEDRALYQTSPVFGAADDARSIHLGTDLWMPAGTPVFAIGAGTVHSFADNAQHGDYGPTIILQHPSADGEPLYTLYGHLARASLTSLTVGQHIDAGQQIGWLGEPTENLGWAPHLHLQCIRDIGDYRGDFPGVCHAREQQMWLERCPSVEPFLQGWMGDVRRHQVSLPT